MLTTEGIAAKIAETFWDIVTNNEPRTEPHVTPNQEGFLVEVRPGGGGSIPIMLKNLGQVSITGITFKMVPPESEFGIVWVVNVTGGGEDRNDEVCRQMERMILAVLHQPPHHNRILIDMVALSVLAGKPEWLDELPIPPASTKVASDLRLAEPKYVVLPWGTTTIDPK